MGLKMRAVVDLAKVGSVDCRKSVATILKGKVAKRMLRHKMRRTPGHQVQNVATKAEKSPCRRTAECRNIN